MKLRFIILLLIVCAGINGQKGNLNQSRWHVNDKIEVSDYQLIKKANIYCFLSNDYNNIYIDLKVNNSGVQNRILKEGLTLWIDMDGKSVKKMGIRFPVGSQNSPGHTNAGLSKNIIKQDGSPVNDLALANTIELIGFITEEERHLPAQNPDSFTGSVKFDKEGTFYYRMVLPIAKLPVRNSKEGNSAMPFNLGIEYGLSPAVNNAGTGSNSAQSSIKPVLQWIKGLKLATSK